MSFSVEKKGGRRTIIRWEPQITITNELLKDMIRISKEADDGFVVRHDTGILTISDWSKVLTYRLSVIDPLTMRGTATFVEGRAVAS